MALLQEDGGRAHTIYRLYAFVGRYGHQDVSSMQQMTVAEIVKFSSLLGQLLEEENRRTTDHD